MISPVAERLHTRWKRGASEHWVCPSEKQGWWVAQLSSPVPLWAQDTGQPGSHASPHQLSCTAGQDQSHGSGSPLGWDSHYQSCPWLRSLLRQVGLLPKDICLCPWRWESSPNFPQCGCSSVIAGGTPTPSSHSTRPLELPGKCKSAHFMGLH